MPEAATKLLGAGAWVGQALLYGAFALFIGVFSQWPSYQHLQDAQSLVKLSFTHTGKPVTECKKQSEAELANLPPNMRAPMRCPRERSPVVVELSIDGTTVSRDVGQPSGLSKDGASSVYKRVVVPAGTHHIVVRLNDDLRNPGFKHVLKREVVLAPGKILVIDFDSSTQQITAR